MTQPEGAVGDVPNDTVVASEPTLEERFAALAKDEEEEEQPEADDAPQAPEATEDEPEAEPEIDDDDLPAIVPPVSWTAEEKEEFANLPRTVQETLTRREAEREKFVQAKANEASRVRHTVEQQALAQVQQMNSTFVQQLQALIPDVPQEPSAHLMNEDPVAYANALDERRWAIEQRNYIASQIQAVEQQQGHLEQQRTAQTNALNAQLLAQEFPEFLDAEKGPDLRKSLRATGLSLGYSEDQLALVDAQDILAMRQASEWKAKAEKFDTLMAKQMDRVRSAKTLPKVSRPGVAVGKGAIEGQRYAADRQAMRSGDQDAAIRVFSRFV